MTDTPHPPDTDYVALCERAAGFIDVEGSGDDEQRRDVADLRALAQLLTDLRECADGLGMIFADAYVNPGLYTVREHEQIERARNAIDALTHSSSPTSV